MSTPRKPAADAVERLDLSHLWDNQSSQASDSWDDQPSRSSAANAVRKARNRMQEEQPRRAPKPVKVKRMGLFGPVYSK
jgi:hypothetical protein